MTRPGIPQSKIERAGHRRSLELRRALADEIRRFREDAGLSQTRLAAAAGISQSVISELEAASCDPGVEVLARIGAALGGRLTVRIDPGAGSPVRDHIQSAITEHLLTAVSPRWKRLVEVPIYRPFRGVIDAVLHDPDEGVIVAAEVQSELRRIEQQLRWLGAKADALGAGGTTPEIASALHLGELATQPRRVDRLLILRCTQRTRQIVATHSELLAAAYPADHATAVQALTADALWPGSALIWADYVNGVASIRVTPPRGIGLGRS